MGLARRYRAAVGRALPGRWNSRGRDAPESRWFWEHYELAAEEILSFCDATGVTLEGRDVADIGCGDGIMALGLCHRARPRRLVGFDVVPTNTEILLRRSRAEGVADVLPTELEFRGSEATSVPAPDAEFHFVYSWSAFEHIANPIEVLSEIRRVLRPDGHFFLQLWPFYCSAKGSHLWDWFDEDFHHLLASDAEIVAGLAASDRHPEDWTSYMMREFEQLNRITLDQLQRAVVDAGFDVRRLDLLTSPTSLTPALARYSWSDLGVSGVKLLATPRS
jgi:ubiquinone/menaquinone biosynthesis C-methylase UbiE